jgi:hypothetical protein
MEKYKIANVTVFFFNKNPAPTSILQERRRRRKTNFRTGKEREKK